MKVALVHDYLNQYGGGERVLSVLSEMFPRAPIYTLVYDEKLTGRAFRGRRIFTSFLQKIPGVRRHHRFWPMLMPLAVEQFDLSRFDLVISNSASFAKGVITKPFTCHLNYCLTPTRFLWDDSQRYLEDFFSSRWIKKFSPLLLNYLRLWDLEASRRVDYFLAISHFVKQRIKKYYRQEAEVLYPPLATRRFHLSAKPGEYFLMIGRLVPYKRFDLGIKAFNQLGWPLLIIGDGPQQKELKAMAKSNIKFVGLVSDYLLPDYYARARAVIFPQEEDFGLVPLEAMAAGRPVIAFKGGGALETVQDKKTGLFFDQQSAESLIETLRQFQAGDFDPQYLHARAWLFDQEIFKEKFKQHLAKITNHHF